MSHRRMFISKVWTDDSRLLEESNLAAEQPRRAPHHIIQATTSEGLAQGPTWLLEWDSNQRPSAPKAQNTTTEPPRPLIALLKSVLFTLQRHSPFANVRQTRRKETCHSLFLYLLHSQGTKYQQILMRYWIQIRADDFVKVFTRGSF